MQDPQCSIDAYSLHGYEIAEADDCDRLRRMRGWEAERARKCKYCGSEVLSEHSGRVCTACITNWKPEWDVPKEEAQPCPR